MFVWMCVWLWSDVCDTSMVQCVSHCDHYHWCLCGCVCGFGLMFVTPVWYNVCHTVITYWCLCGCVCGFGLMFVTPVWYNVYHTVITFTDGCVCGFGLMFVTPVWYNVYHTVITIIDVCVAVCSFGLMFVTPVWYNVYHTVITITDGCVAVCVALVWCLWHQYGTMCITLWSLSLMFVWLCVWLWFDVCDTSVVQCVSHCDHYHWCLCGCVCGFGLMFVTPVWYNVYHTVITFTDGCVCGFGLMFVVQCVSHCDHYHWCLCGCVCGFGLVFVTPVWYNVYHTDHSLMFVWLCVWLWFDVCGTMCITLWSLSLMFVWLCVWLWFGVCDTSVVQCVSHWSLIDVCVAVCVALVWCLSLYVAKSLLLMFVWPCLCLWFDVCLCVRHQCGMMCISVSDHWSTSYHICVACVWLWGADVSGWNASTDKQGVILERREIMYKTIQVLSRALLLCCNICELLSKLILWNLVSWDGVYMIYISSVHCWLFCICVCVCVCWMQAACLVDNWQTSKVGYIMWLFSLPPLPFPLPPWEIRVIFKHHEGCWI